MVSTTSMLTKLVLTMITSTVWVALTLPRWFLNRSTYVSLFTISYHSAEVFCCVINVAFYNMILPIITTYHCLSYLIIQQHLHQGFCWCHKHYHFVNHNNHSCCPLWFSGQLQSLSNQIQVAEKVCRPVVKKVSYHDGHESWKWRWKLKL